MNNPAVNYMNKVIDQQSEALDYHSQEGTKTPRLTYSIAKLLLAKSPLHAWYNHPLLGGHKLTPSKTMDLGSIGHDLLLGGGDPIDILDFDSYRKKEAQELKKDSYEAGHIPVLRKDYEKLEVTVSKVKEQLSLYLPEFFHEHISEHPVIWEADNGVECQSKYDWVSLDSGLMIDLKFTTDASPEKCTRKIIDMGYDLQEAFYTEALNKTYPELAGRTKWLFVFIETEEPYAISVIETDSTFKEIGRLKMNTALDIWESCLESNNWPAYGQQTVSAPGWAVYKMGEES